MSNSAQLLNVANFLQAVCFFRGCVCAYRVLSCTKDENGRKNKDQWICYILLLITLRLFDDATDKALSYIFTNYSVVKLSFYMLCCVTQKDAFSAVYDILDQRTTFFGFKESGIVVDERANHYKVIQEPSKNFLGAPNELGGSNQFMKISIREKQRNISPSTTEVHTDKLETESVVDSRESLWEEEDSHPNFGNAVNNSLYSSIRNKKKQYLSKKNTRDSLPMYTTNPSYANAIKKARQLDLRVNRSIRAAPVELVKESMGSKVQFNILRNLICRKKKEKYDENSIICHY